MSDYKTGMFCWNEIGTRDTAAAKKFYTELFSWGAQDVPMPGNAGTYTLLQMDGKDVAGLYEMKGPQFEGVPPHWMVYVWSDDVDATAAQVKKLGGALMFEPMDVPGVGRMTVAQDSTGAKFAIFKGGDHKGAYKPDLRHGAFCWRELVTPNPDAAGSFYTNLFGWNTKKGQDAGPVDYTEFQTGGASVAGMMAPTPEMGEVPPYWGLYVHVDDCDETVKKAEALGGKAVAPPMDIDNVGRMSVLCDPTGAMISIIKLKIPA